MPFVLKITDAGIAAAAAAASTGPVVISQLGLTNTPFDFAPTLEVLPGEFKRLASVAARTGDNLVYLEAFDNSPDVWTANGLALYLADGTLFAAISAGQPIVAKASLAFSLIALDVTFAASIAASITFGDLVFTNPPATTENRGIIEIATQTEALNGTDDQRALTPKAAKGAVQEWLFLKPVRLGQVDVQTPNNGSTGGLRIWANGTTQVGILQALSPNGLVEWGYAEFTQAASFNWRGVGGIRAGGSTAWKGNIFDGPIDIDGNVYIKNGADLVFGSQAPGFDFALIYNDSGTLGFRASGNEQIYIAADGVVHVKGPRPLGNQDTIPGSGGLRVYAGVPGGHAVTTYDRFNHWSLQCVRDVSGTAAMQGGIYVTDSGTSFVTNSDHRLKEDLRPVETPLQRLLQLKPCNFKWKGKDRRTDGFIAHELQDVIPEAVTGTRDAMREVTIVEPVAGDGSLDVDGNAREAFGPGVHRFVQVPDLQAVDQAKVVPLLTAALQELASIVEEQGKAIAMLQSRRRKSGSAA